MYGRVYLICIICCICKCKGHISSGQECRQRCSICDGNHCPGLISLVNSNAGLSERDPPSCASCKVFVRLGSNYPQSAAAYVDQVNTLHLQSNLYHLASSSSDGTVAVWDVRNMGAAGHSSGSNSKPRRATSVCKVSHQKSSQGAYWCPDGGCRLLSISFDDTLRVWKDPAGKAQLQQEVGYGGSLIRDTLLQDLKGCSSGMRYLVDFQARAVKMVTAGSVSYGIVWWSGCAPDYLSAHLPLVAIHKSI